jgi:EKC/KEOPS complex subunit CGI121/TPRKB
MMETYYYTHFNHAVVHVALFNDVTNSAAIRSRIIQAARIPGVDGDTKREAINFAFIDARLVRIPTRFDVMVSLTMFPDLESTSPPDRDLSGSFI